MSVLSEKLVKAQKEIKQLQDELRNKTIDYNNLDDQFNAMTKDRDYWENKWRELQKGALGYHINEEGYILMAFNVPNDFYTTYPQEIDVSVINTPLYQQFPYYKIKNGEIYIDTDNRKKYLGGIA